MVHKRVSPLRQQRREGTIDGIVAAALEILVEEGYEALTIARLAERVEYTVGALYRYFASKDDLMVAVQERVLQTVQGDLQKALALIDGDLARRSTTPARSALMRLLVVPLVHEKVAAERPTFFALLSLSVATPQPLVATDKAQPSLVALMNLNLTVATLLEAAAESGALEPGPSSRRAVVLWGAQQGILSLRKLSRFGAPALASDNLTLDLVRPLLRGWGAKAAELEALWPRARRIVLGE
jgi:AcrR family transcriptional regulator